MLDKSTFLEQLASTDRGLKSTPAQQQQIAVQIAQIEAQNPNPRPFESLAMLEGDWRLVYTNSQGILGLDRFPLLNLGKVYQSLRCDTSQLYNVAEIQGLPLLSGIVNVGATFEVVSEVRVEVAFNRAIVGPKSLMGYNGPADFIRSLEAGKRYLALDIPLASKSARGWLDITYLDETLRIGRGNEGSLFVLVKD
jgi:hypothetical protein